MTALPSLEHLADLLIGGRRSGPPPRLLITTAYEILDALDRHGVMRRKEIALAAGLDPRHGTIGDALRLLTSVGVIGRPDGSTRYVLLAGQLEELLTADQSEPEDDEFEEVVEVEPPGLPAPTCQCGGQVYRSEEESRCLKCGRRPAVAA